MLPLADTIRSRSFPIITWLVIAANALVFFFELGLSDAQLEAFIYTYALTPSLVDFSNPGTLTPFVTHQFLHGGWIHLLSNMWILFIFGDNVEDRMGPVRYLFFYLAGGIAAGFIQTYFAIDPTVPSLGASGAVATVLGAYLIFYPGARVLSLIPIFFFPWIVRVPAVIFIGLWFASQLFSGLASLLPDAAATNVAWFAHIGGFLFGVIAGRPMVVGRARPRWWPDEYAPW